MAKCRSERKQQYHCWARVIWRPFTATICIILNSLQQCLTLSVCTGSGYKNRITFCFFLYTQSAEFYLGKSCKMKCAANTRSQTPEEIKFRKMYLFHVSPSLVHSLCDCIKVEESPFQRFRKVPPSWFSGLLLHFHWFFLFKDPCRLILYCYSEWTKLEFSK